MQRNITPKSEAAPSTQSEALASPAPTQALAANFVQALLLTADSDAPTCPCPPWISSCSTLAHAPLQIPPPQPL